MKAIKSLLMLSVCTLSTFSISVVTNHNKVLAENPGNSARNYCSTVTLTGAYASQLTGFLGNREPFTPVAAVRLFNFDGHGNLSGRGFVSAGGNVSEQTFTGTYQVERDCTVQIIFNVLRQDGTQVQNTLFGVIADEGEKIYNINTAFTAAPATVSGIFEKVR